MGNFVFWLQTWTRQITPIVGDMTSYAVAFVSHREDGEPYAITTLLSQIGLLHRKGYSVVDLYNNIVVFQAIQTNQQFPVRINPTGSLKKNVSKKFTLQIDIPHFICRCRIF